jgi:hypothetical protein
MSIGEIILAILVGIVFVLGLWGGWRLFQWNQQDRKELEERNKRKRETEVV